jgi:hypothetical protein
MDLYSVIVINIIDIQKVKARVRHAAISAANISYLWIAQKIVSYWLNTPYVPCSTLLPISNA